MDTVTFDGVEYLKASVAAKQFRYTSDYIGQLCRGKKIDARLVGRTWFVNPESIKEHKNSRHQKTLADPRSEKSEVTLTVVQNVRPTRKPEMIAAVRNLTMRQSVQAGEGSSERHLRVSYEPDDGNLIPAIHKKHQKPPKTILIEHVDAQRISITGKKDEISFEADELPEVSLSGTVTVTDYPEEQTFDQEQGKQIQEDSGDRRDNLKNKRISAKQYSHKELEGAEIDPEKESVSVLKTRYGSSDRKPISDASETREVKIASDVMKTSVQENVSVIPSSFTPNSIANRPAKEVSTVVLVSPLIATFVAVACVIFIMFASTSVTVTQSAYESHIVLQVANLLELFSH